MPTLNPTLAKFLLRRFKGYAQKMANGQGMGRHTQQEVYAIARGDLESLSKFIGKYLYSYYIVNYLTFDF